MIDFHTHILPGIDDGSRNVEISIQMLHEEKQMGIDHVVFTPHFYANRNSMDNFLKHRNRSIQQLQAEVERCPELSGMKYNYGAEVYYFGGIGNASDVKKLCIADTDILLLEMPFCQWTDEMYTDIVHLQRKQGLTVVLAHIERYSDFQKKMHVWDQVFELPVIAQMNAGPFMDWKRRRKVLKLASVQDQLLLGSDAHNMDNRRPNMAGAIEVIQKKLGDHMTATISRTEQLLLGDIR